MTYELPKRQLEILTMVAQGTSGAEIGRRLHISSDTVKSHLRSLYGSMGARNAPHAVAIAYGLGILSVKEDCCRQHLLRWLSDQVRDARQEIRGRSDA